MPTRYMCKYVHEYLHMYMYIHICSSIEGRRMYVYIYIYLYIRTYIESGLAVSFLQLCFCSIAWALAHDIRTRSLSSTTRMTATGCNRLQQAATGSDTLTIPATTSSLWRVACCAKTWEHAHTTHNNAKTARTHTTHNNVHNTISRTLIKRI